MNKLTEQERIELSRKLDILADDCYKVAYGEIQHNEARHQEYIEDNMFGTMHDIERWLEQKKKQWQEEAYEEGFNKAQEVDEERRNKLNICKKCGKPIGNYQQCMNCLRGSMEFYLFP